MMHFLKNKETRIPFLLQLLLSVLATTLCTLFDPRAGGVTLLFALLFLLISSVATHQRYKKIASLAEDINTLLHGNLALSLENYAEGELAILHSEIYKMTVRLREQQQRLLQDKTYLADSIADISHQIRTPLTTINLMVQLLSDPSLSDDRRRQIARELRDLLSRMDWLITTLLKISKLDAGTVHFHQETVPLETLITKACSPLLVPIELRGQELSVAATGEFTGDVAWTCEAIGNIVKNCMEHTPTGGTIEITAVENALYSEIILRDTGPGIAKEDLPRIFERFYKGKNSDDKSFGIGLALARTIITSQNGTVKAENRTPSGAVFTLRFYKGIV